MDVGDLKGLFGEVRKRMDAQIEHVRRELGGVRTGRASVTILDAVHVEAYGSHVPLNQVGLVSAPEARLLTVQPFDKSLAPVIEKAIREADLGLNPSTQSGIIRVPLPPLSEERRKELVKVVHKLAEEGRIAVRHARTETMSRLKKLEHTSADDEKRAEKDVQKLHDEHIKQIDALIRAKEAEIMEV